MDFKDIVKQVKEGDLNALSIYVDLKRYENELTDALSQIKDFALDEASKYPEKTFKAFGAIIEKKSGASRWDYSQVTEWNLAKERLKQIETIAQVGGMDDSGNEIQRAFKVPGKDTIAIKLLDEAT
jgi:hypothetical protein